MNLIKYIFRTRKKSVSMMLALVLLLSGLTADTRSAYIYADDNVSTGASNEDTSDGQDADDHSDSSEKENDQKEEKEEEKKDGEKKEDKEDGEKKEEEKKEDKEDRDKQEEEKKEDKEEEESGEENREENSREQKNEEKKESGEAADNKPAEGSEGHSHVFEKYVSNGDGTHSVFCTIDGCNEKYTENCSYDESGKCSKCGYEKANGGAADGAEPAKDETALNDKESVSSQDTEKEEEEEEGLSEEEAGKEDISGDGIETEKEYTVLESGGVRVEGLLPKGTVLRVSEIGKAEARELVEDEGKDKAVLLAYDITLLCGEEEIQPDESVRVTIEPPETVDKELLKEGDMELIHVTSEDNNESVDVEVGNDGDIKFETEGFSPFILLLGSGSIDYNEPAAGLYFSQRINVNFSDASLINPGDMVKVTIYGNINKKKLKDGDSENSEIIELLSNELTINNIKDNKASLVFDFNNVPVYLKGGTGNVNDGGNGTYEMPEDFYGVAVEKTVNGYLPEITGTTLSDGVKTYGVLSPVKDPNNTEWSTSEVTVNHKILELVKPHFTIEWQDNRNYADKRPYSKGYYIRSGGEDEIASGIDLYVKEGDSYTLVSDNSPILVAPGSNHPKVSYASFSSWSVAYSNLPKNKEDGTTYEWYIRPNEKLINDGEDRKGCYNISDDGYILISGDSDAKLTFTYTDGISGRIVWRISDDSVVPPLPGDSLFTAAGMKLYRKKGDTDAEETTVSGSAVSWNESTESGNRVWSYSIKGFPLYAENGDAITYYTVMESNPFYYSEKNTKFKFTYDNGSFSSDSDKCYSGETIYATVTDNAEFSFDKKWLDGGDLERRKAAIEKGITLYLWRYPVNKGIAAGAPVTKDAKQYTLRLSENDAGDAGNNSIRIDLSKFSSDSFPKYDEMGYEYVYYVTEVSDSGLYRTVYPDGKDVKNGEVLKNVRSAKIAPTIIKQWDVAAVTDYVSSVCTFMLQRKENGEWKNVEEKTLTGFSSSKKSIEGVFSPQELYDDNGDRYDYRAVETAVKAGTGEAAVFSSGVSGDSLGIWSSTYELKDHTYSSSSEYRTVLRDGAETAVIRVTDRLSGTKKLYIIKKWTGSGWNIGTTGSKTGDITFELRRRIDGEAESVYATVSMIKPASPAGETSGSGSLVVTSSDPALISTNSYTIENDGNTWKSTAMTVPAYTGDGRQYIYTLDEKAVASPDTELHYAEEYDRHISGKEIKLYINNHIGSETVKTRLRIEKIWHDDSDNSQRSPVRVWLGTYDDEGNFNQALSGNMKGHPYYVDLISGNDYDSYIWVDGADFISENQMSAFNEATSENQKAMRTEAINNRLAIKAALYNENTKDYDRFLNNIGFVSNNKTVSGGTVDAVVSGDSYKPGYRVSVAKENGSFTITNTRVGSRSFSFTKNWIDSDNRLKGRGDFLRVALFREESGVEKEIAYRDIPTYMPDGVTLTSGTDLTVEFTNNGEYYPAYDLSGNNYVYSLKEYICKGKNPATGEKQCDPEGNEADIDIPDSKTEVLLSATEDTTKTGYVVKEDPETSSITEISGTHDLGKDGTKSFLISESSGHTNRAAGDREDVEFYCIWHDKAKNDQRPDVFFTLYYNGGDGGEIIPYTGSYTERWVDVVSGNKFIQKAIFSGVPAADVSGNVYEYYVAETLNNDVIGYSVDHYSEPLFNAAEALSDLNTAVVSANSGQIIVKNGVSKDDVAAADGTLLIKEKSFGVSTIHDSIHIEGRKLWINIPEGIEVDRLPSAYIYLFRDSEYDHAHKVPDVSGAADLEEKKAAYSAKAVEAIALNDGSESPRKLNAAKSMYIFGTYKADNTTPDSYVNFPKYDDMGALYKYTVSECIYNFKNNELPADIMIPNYSDNTTDIANHYKLNAETNRRSFRITKQWKVDELHNKGTVNAKATFRLYRMELKDDGNGYNATHYAWDDSSLSDPSSSATAAAAFNISSNDLELISENILEKPATEVNSEINNWTDLPIFAPSGRIYAYYAVEMIDDMPGYKVALNGKNPKAVSDNGSGPAAGNTALSENSSYVGVAFANSDISIAYTGEENKKNTKEETFRNTYKQMGFLTLKFEKKWDTQTNDGIDEASMVPDIGDEGDKSKRALSFKIRAEAKTQSGKKNPETVSFNEGTDYSIINVSANSSDPKRWYYTVSFNKPVPFYSANGNVYTYYVEEIFNTAFVKANYKATRSTIYNTADIATPGEPDDNDHRVLNMTHALGNELKGEFSVRKQWDDFNDDYGMREGAVVFDVERRLGRTDTFTKYIENISLNKANKWTRSFKKLPVSANNAEGEKYEYRIVETEIRPGTGAAITVSYPAVSANAQWIPNGKDAPDSGSYFAPVEAGNYKVYDPADITLPASGTRLIVNQLDTGRAVVSLNVIKKWEDNGDSAGLRPERLTIRIDKSTDDGATWTQLVKRTMTKAADQDPSDPDVWVHTYNNLPKYYGSGISNIYKYRAVETKIGTGDGGDTGLDNDYSSSDNALTGSGGSYSVSHSNGAPVRDASNEVIAYSTTITNKIILREKPVIVRKIWNDGKAAGHEGVKAALYSKNYTGGSAASAVVDPSKESTLTKLSLSVNEVTLTDPNPEYSYNGLPKYNKDKELIVYYVKEETTGSFKTQYASSTGTAVPGNAVHADQLPHSSTDPSDSDKTFYVNIINTPLTSVSVSKNWSDDNDAYGLRPDSLVFMLQRRKVDPAGNVLNWETVTKAEHKKTDPSETASTDPVTVTLKKSENWAAKTVSKLPLYVLNGGKGTKYQYRLSENNIPNGYTLKADGTKGVTADDEGYSYDFSDDSQHKSVVTNRLIRRSDISVNKLWNTDSQPDIVDVNVSLYSKNAVNGSDTGAGNLSIYKISGNAAEKTLNGNGTVVFSGLPLYNKDGQEIIYYVIENRSESFSTVYKTGDGRSLTDPGEVKNLPGGGAFEVTVINTPYTSAYVEKSWNDREDKFKTRPVSVNLLLQRRENGGSYEAVSWNDIPDNDSAKEMIGKGKGDNKAVIKLDESVSWKGILHKLPHYKAYAGAIIKYDYRFIETDESGKPYVPFGYSLDPSAAEYKKTNTGDETGYVHSYSETEGYKTYKTKVTNTLITKDAVAVKKWNDYSDSLKIRPDEITLYVSENTAVTRSIDSFNKRFLGGMTDKKPFGVSPYSNLSGTGISPVKSDGGDTWTYSFKDLPKYAYGDDADPDSPKEIEYMVTEDINRKYDGFTLRDYYAVSHNYGVRKDETDILNTVMKNDGSLIIEKVIEKWDPSEPDFNDTFTFNVTLKRPDATMAPFEGYYRICKSGDVTSLSSGQLRDEAFKDDSTYFGSPVKAENGKIKLKAGQTAVLTGINSRYYYEVTEDPTGDSEDPVYGYDLCGIKNIRGDHTDNCTAKYDTFPATVTGETEDTHLVSENGNYIKGIAKGKIAGIGEIPPKVIFTNRLFDPESYRLKVKNTTESGIGDNGEITKGGWVKIYHSRTVVDRSDEIGKNSGSYVGTETRYIEQAMSVEFKPDTANGYRYGDSLTIKWWDDMEPDESKPEGSITITGYINEEDELPYTGSISDEVSGNSASGNNVSDNDVSGNDTADGSASGNDAVSDNDNTSGSGVSGNNRPEADLSGNDSPDDTDLSGNDTPENETEEEKAAREKFESIWAPLIERGKFKHITVLNGSVVLTLANDYKEMPHKVLVEVNFKAPDPEPDPEPGPGPDPKPDPEPDPKPVPPKPDPKPPVPDNDGGVGDSGNSGGNTDSSASTASDSGNGRKHSHTESDGTNVDANGDAADAFLSGSLPYRASGSDGDRALSTNKASGKGIRTGDDRPIELLLSLLALLLLLFAAVITLLVRRRKDEKG